jgi:hypothetical protein
MKYFAAQVRILFYYSFPSELRTTLTRGTRSPDRYRFSTAENGWEKFQPGNAIEINDVVMKTHGCSIIGFERLSASKKVVESSRGNVTV